MNDSDCSLLTCMVAFHFCILQYSHPFYILCHPVCYHSTPLLKYCGNKFCNVCVLSYLCRLVAGGIPEGHFTHVFVDEAGHAVETECLVPLAGKEYKQHNVFYNCIELVLCVG